MSKTDNVHDYLTALANSFRVAMGSDDKLNAQDMLTYAPLLANGYEEFKNVVSRNYANSTELPIPVGITKIGDYAYAGIEKRFTDLIIPEGIEEIGLSAFSSITYDTIHLPKSIKKIDGAFSDYSGKRYNAKYNGSLSEYLKINFVNANSTLVYGNFWEDKTLYLNNEATKNILITNDVTEDLTALPQYNLDKFNFDSFRFSDDTKITSIPANSISNHSKLIEFPKNLTGLLYDFQNSQSETYIFKGTLTDYINITNLRTSFCQSEKVKEIYFDNKLIDFSKGIVIPDGVTTINKYTFQYWTKLAKTLVIPSSVTSILDYSFTCYSSDKQGKGIVIFKGNNPPTCSSSSFTSKSNYEKFLVPKGRLSVFKSATNLSKFADIMQESTSNIINVDSSLLNNENITYSLDGGDKQQFTSSNFTLEVVGTLTIYNNEVGATIKVGTTNGGTEIGTSGENTAITYTFTNDGTIYITKA